MPKRIDGADTVDTATHFLHRLQAEGWVLDELEHFVEYSSPTAKGQKMPISATVTVRLSPIR
jgi:hypothetical protein